MSSVNIETVTISYALHYRAARDYANSPIVYIYTLTIQIRRNVNLNIHSFQRMDISFPNIFHRTYIFIRNWEKFRRIRLIELFFLKINFKFALESLPRRNIDTNVCGSRI